MVESALAMRPTQKRVPLDETRGSMIDASQSQLGSSGFRGLAQRLLTWD
jgi:hypothetical protein